jgi:hypothetical protein
MRRLQGVPDAAAAWLAEVGVNMPSVSGREFQRAARAARAPDALDEEGEVLLRRPEAAR